MYYKFKIALLLIVIGNAPVLAATYVTQRDVSIDRCGTAWFISRFLDPDAEFLFFKPGEAAPEGVTYAYFGSKYFNKGPDCTFAVMVKAHKKAGLKPLQKMNEQINDVFAWRSGPESLATRLRKGIGDLREANESDLMTYKRIFPVFDFLYLAYGGDPAAMLPGPRRHMPHLPARIVLELADRDGLSKLPEYPVAGDLTDQQFQSAIQGFYDQLEAATLNAVPLAGSPPSKERDSQKEAFAALLRWMETTDFSTEERQVLQRLYLLVGRQVWDFTTTK